MIGSALRFTAVALSASAVGLASMAAQAQPTGKSVDVRSPPAYSRPQVRDKVVSYADLDLNSPTGQKTMLTRLKTASRYVCGHKPAASVAKKTFNDCYDEAMTNALSTLGNSQVTAMYKK
ncbi:MAG: UrcA family protein [Caulobacteraceae bacterium]|nr:UrcA family protein [Caulobacteraceae bacterium]